MEWTTLLSGKRDNNWTTGIDVPKVDTKNLNPPQETSMPQVLIGQGSSINGELQLEGEAQILGKIQGEIIAKDSLVIGESAVIHADIQARQVKVFGCVRGDIDCKEHLELHAGASVTGNITSPSLVIQEGVIFEGFCKMKTPQTDLVDDSDENAIKKGNNSISPGDNWT